MALGAVEMGIMKPIDAPRVAPRAGSIGSTFEAVATAMATGTTMLAEAVFDVVSESRMATPVKTVVSSIGPAPGSHDVSPSPIAVARPVEKARSPIASPPPYSSTMPQSIRAASSQVIVNLRAAQCTGSTNSSIAPSIAATPSGTEVM